MKARMESLDMLANNIANSGTAGFKADREFYNLYQQELPVIETQWTDFSQGTVLPTGNPLNLALSGKGFFALNGPSGTVYTRNGNFQISKTNQIGTSEGYTLRNVLDKGNPMTVDAAEPITIDKDGMVTQGGQQVGQIEVSEIPSAANGLNKLGNSYFSLNLGAASSAQGTEILQGQLEQSNVPVAESAVRLVSVMRQFEMLQKAMNLTSQMNKEAIQEVAKVG
jgi:flagellar basal body rod protein FlgG